MGLRFYMGASGAGKSRAVYRNIIDRSIKEPDTNFLIIVPDQFTMQTQKDLCRLHPRDGIMNIDVLSFSRLSFRVFDEVGTAEKVILDDTGKNLILRKIASRKENELVIMGSHIKKTGYIHEVKSVISEFFQYDIGVRELEDFIEYARNKGTLAYKLKDLKLLYEEFIDYINDDKTGHGKYITAEESLDLLVAVLARSRIIADSVIVFDGFTGFTPVQNKVLAKLMELSREVIVTLTVDKKETLLAIQGEQNLFYLSKKTYDSLEQMAKEAAVKREEDVVLSGKPVYRYRDNPGLAHLEQNLFRYHSTCFMREQKAVSIIEAGGPKEEIQFLCTEIKRCIREEGYCYRDIAVVTGDLNRYAHLAEEQFALSGIPLFLDRTSGLLFHPFTEFISSALQVIIKDFSYESVFHFLRTGLTDMGMEEIDRLENYIIRTGIRGKKRYAHAFTATGKLVGEGALAELNRSREVLMQTLAPLLQLTGKKNAAQCTAVQCVRAVYDMCVNIKMQERLRIWGEKIKDKEQEYNQIYPAVMDLLDQIYSLLGEDVLSVEEFAEIMTAGFSEIQIGILPQNVDQVVVGDIERTRLRNIKALFFVGVNDGIVPKTSSNGGIISDMEREFLQASGKELAPTPRQRVFIQRLYLYNNMTKPTEKLYLTYCRVDGQGKTMRPSYLIGSIRKLYQNLPVKQAGEAGLLAGIADKEGGRECLAMLLREYAAGLLEEEAEGKRLFFTLYKSYMAYPETAAEQLVEAAFSHYESSTLSKDTAKLLYGEMFAGSVSRLEQFAACAYAHFLKYGLALKERDEFAFEAMDMGNIFHGVLEGFTEYLEQQGKTWFDFTSETADNYISRTLAEYAAEYGDTILYSSARNAYILKQMERILSRTLHTLQYQLKKGLFVPAKVEAAFSFGEEGQMKGRIDRIDTVEKDGTVYVKVIDYKSGNVQFDPVDLYYGLQMQLAVYLNAAVAMEQKKNPDKKVVPAAMLYYHMQDPFVEGKEAESAAQVESKIQKELRMNGLVNESAEIVSMLDTSMSDTSMPEGASMSDVIPVERKKDGSYKSTSSVGTTGEFEIIAEYVNYKIKEIGKEIAGGSLSLNPYEKGNQNACEYCIYNSVCKFDKRIPGHTMRNLDKISKAEAKEKMAEAVEKGVN